MPTSTPAYKFRFERTIFWIVFAALLISLSVWKVIQWSDGSGDNTFLIQLARNIAKTGRPVSEVMGSVDIILREWVASGVEQACRFPLTLPKVHDFNYFRWHTYIILYLIAPIHFFVDPRYTIPILTVVSFVSLLGMAFFTLRRRDVSLPISLLALGMIAAHPAWSDGLQGQVYSDRFFVGLGFLLALLLSEEKKNIRLISIVALLCASISDRFGLVTGSILIGNEILNFPRTRKLNRKLIVLGAACAIFSLAIVKLYIRHPQYESFASSMRLPNFLYNLSRPEFTHKLEFFLALNVLLFASISAFSWRWLLIALIWMAPNILGDIGGAEKTGFLTHYHSIYFPILAWAFVDSVSKVSRWLKVQNKISYRVGFTGLMALGLIMLVGLFNASQPFTFSKSNLFGQGLMIPFTQLPAYFEPAAVARREELSTLIGHLRKGSVVSLPESLMPEFSTDFDIHYYPVGVAAADYVVLTRDPAAPPGRYYGVVTYLGEEAREKIDRCTLDRMKDYNFDIDHPFLLGPYVVFERGQPK
jgi:hypothetical protein